MRAEKSEISFNPEAKSPYKPGDIRIIDGVVHRAIDSGYTLHQFFAHSTPEKGPGPGWILESDF